MMKNLLRVPGGVWQGWRQSTYKPLATPWPPQAKSTTQCAYLFLDGLRRYTFVSTRQDEARFYVLLAGTANTRRQHISADVVQS